MKRIAVTIHVLQIGETAWAWELRDLDGALMSHSGIIGEFAVFASYSAAFGDACAVYMRGHGKVATECMTGT